MEVLLISSVLFALHNRVFGLTSQSLVLKAAATAVTEWNTRNQRD